MCLKIVRVEDPAKKQSAIYNKHYTALSHGVFCYNPNCYNHFVYLHDDEFILMLNTNFLHFHFKYITIYNLFGHCYSQTVRKSNSFKF